MLTPPARHANDKQTKHRIVHDIFNIGLGGRGRAGLGTLICALRVVQHWSRGTGVLAATPKLSLVHGGWFFLKAGSFTRSRVRRSSRRQRIRKLSYGDPPAAWRYTELVWRHTGRHTLPTAGFGYLWTVRRYAQYDLETRGLTHVVHNVIWDP